jgi:hypothetical protein
MRFELLKVALVRGGWAGAKVTGGRAVKVKVTDAVWVVRSREETETGAASDNE